MKKVNFGKKEVENISYKNCKKEGHDEDHCWHFHPKMKPKWIGEGKQKVAATAKPLDLGSNLGDETQIASLIMTSKYDEGNDSNISRGKLFHIRVVMKHQNIDTLLAIGSRVNVISEKVVKQVGLKTIKHHKPYTVIWIRRNHKLQLTEQCMLPFSITSQFKGKVMFDVVKLDTCGMVLGSPYLYDRKEIFYREQNQYHLFQKGIEYIVHYHHTKGDKFVFIVEQLKQEAYANKYVVVQSKEPKQEKIKASYKQIALLKESKIVHLQEL